MTEGIDVYDAADMLILNFLWKRFPVLILLWMRVIWLLRKYPHC